MVVAGVFQIARMFPLWVEYAQPQMSIVVWVGVFTAFYAAAVACAPHGAECRHCGMPY